MTRLAFLSLALFVVGCSSSETAAPPTTSDVGGTDVSTPADVEEHDMGTPPGDDTGTPPIEDTASPPSETGGTTVTVNVGNFYYKPASVTIKVGDTVRWKWDGGTHTVTSGAGCTSDGKFDSGNKTSSTFVFTRKFDTAGTFPYFCDFMDHCSARGQKGTVVVTP